MGQKILVKIQYNNFEPGEFVYNQYLDFEDTLPVIQSFPWEVERTKFHVDLTSPSITFQIDANLFLKLALYYKKKFILHCYDGNICTLVLSQILKAHFPLLNTFLFIRL